MASLMITGGKIGQILGRKRAFAIGCVIYGCGSLHDGIAPNLAVLIIGWSFLEGIGAALILPAIVALVASNFGRAERPRAYGLVASAGAIAVAAGPLIGGLFTTYLSWRLVFAGEVLIVSAILALTRRMADAPPRPGAARPRWDRAVGARPRADRVRHPALRTWGFVQPKPSAPEWLGLSPSIWLILAGGVVLWLFLEWENRRVARGAGRAHRPGDPARTRRCAAGSRRSSSSTCCRRAVLRRPPVPVGGPRAVGDRHRGAAPAAVDHAAAGRRRHPQGVPERLTAPRGAARVLALFAGIVVMIAALDAGAGPEIVTWPMLLAGLGIGALASQLGSVTVSSVPDEQSSEVGGLQNTGHQPRRLDRHRARRRGADLRPHHLVPHRHRAEPGRARRGHRQARSSSPPGSRSSPTEQRALIIAVRGRGPHAGRLGRGRLEGHRGECTWQRLMECSFTTAPTRA